MPRTFRLATLFVAPLLLLSACASATTQASPPATPTTAPATVQPAAPPTPAPTSPAPTAVPALANNVLAAGVDLGGLAPEEARQKLADALAALMRPLEVQLGDQQIMLKPDEIGFELALSEMLDQA